MHRECPAPLACVVVAVLIGIAALPHSFAFWACAALLLVGMALGASGAENKQGLAGVLPVVGIALNCLGLLYLLWLVYLQSLGPFLLG